MPGLSPLPVPTVGQDPCSTFKAQPSPLCFQVTRTSPLLPHISLGLPWDDTEVTLPPRMISISRPTSFIHICEVPFTISVPLLRRL